MNGLSGFDGSSYWIVMRFYSMTLTKWRARLGQPLEDHLLDLLEVGGVTTAVSPSVSDLS